MPIPIPGIIIVFEDEMFFIEGDQAEILSSIKLTLREANFTIEANKIEPEDNFNMHSEDIDDLLSSSITIRPCKK